MRLTIARSIVSSAGPVMGTLGALPPLSKGSSHDVGMALAASSSASLRTSSLLAPSTSELLACAELVDRARIAAMGLPQYSHWTGSSTISWPSMLGSQASEAMSYVTW